MKRATIPLVIVIVFLLIALVMLFQNPGPKSTARDITYSELLKSEPHIRDISFHGDTVFGHDDKDLSFTAVLPHDPSIPTRLAQNHVAVVIGPPEDTQNWLVTLLVNGLPLLAYVFLLTWPMYRISRAIDALTRRLEGGARDHDRPDELQAGR